MSDAQRDQICNQHLVSKSGLALLGHVKSQAVSTDLIEAPWALPADLLLQISSDTRQARTILAVVAPWEALETTTALRNLSGLMHVQRNLR